MNILFLTISRIFDLEQRGIYPDLLREFVKNEHNVTIVAPAERRFKEETNFKKYDGYNVLRVKIGNMQKTNVIEKGITTITLESQFLSAIKKYCADTKFDLIMYSTPPITFSKIIKYFKRRDNAKTYLLLKDIFPQNAVDIGMMKKTGVKAPLYRFFRNKEKKLYAISDKIGCMSQANVHYVLNNNSELSPGRVEICPNSIDAVDERMSSEQKAEIRKRYGIPLDKKVFIYGGNLGRPQDIPFVIECLKTNAEFEDRFFVICGTGTEYHKLKAYIDDEKPKNVLLINGLQKNEYESFVGCCDVGLIFLDHRFTIPNFPSRLLSYMQKGMPVLACTDTNTDIGKVITDGGFGWWCESVSPEEFIQKVEEAIRADLSAMGEKAFSYLLDNYTVDAGYETIMSSISEG